MCVQGADGYPRVCLIFLHVQVHSFPFATRFLGHHRHGPYQSMGCSLVDSREVGRLLTGLANDIVRLIQDVFEGFSPLWGSNYPVCYTRRMGIVSR